MGVDITAFVETKRKDDDSEDDWDYLCEYKFSRNYALFALMAGVDRYSSYPNPEALEEALRKRGATRLDDPNLSLEEGVEIMKEGCDTGLTGGQPSFDEKGVPKNASWKTSEEYTLIIVDEDEEEGTCTRAQADAWVTGGSSEVWNTWTDGKPLRVTNPDLFMGSWLDHDEVRAVADRFRVKLLADMPKAMKAQYESVEWAKRGLATAKKEDNEERIAFFARELARESDWKGYNPLSEHAYVATEALAALMASLDAHGVRSRVVFWFDN